MALMIGIDTGGTYTDAVLFDEREGVLASAKALTTKHDLAVGVREAVAAVLPEDPSQVRLVSLSTTLATNAIVEGQGGAVTLVMIGQRPDALERSGLRKALGADPVIWLPGGHEADGREHEPLELGGARAAIVEHARHVSAFAVAGCFAVRNAAHECAVRDLIRELTGLPVTCSHELSSSLDAPRRALTAVLNARLIGLLQDLVLVVRSMLATWRIDSPVMVVMGDGSLVASELALTRPVETILSGPAASVIGARHLAGERNGYVVDIGGTTTDIALLRDGWPALALDGATVAGWRTMVQAVSVHTVGLGGDSEVCVGADHRLWVGPRRTLPLALLAKTHPAVVDVLKDQRDRGYPRTHDGRFALRLRHVDSTPPGLTTGEDRLWQALAAGPMALEKLLAAHPLDRQLERLVRRGLVLIAAFTPSDAAHVLGWHGEWVTEAAALGAALWARRDGIEGWQPRDPPEAFCERVVEQLVLQSGETLLEAALLDQLGIDLGPAHGPGRELVRRSLRPDAEAELIAVKVSLNRPIIAIGAPAATYYPEVAARLGCVLEVPPHADVCNAVGAVASGVMQSVKVLVTQPEQGRFRAHLGERVDDFADLERAVEAATADAGQRALSQALDAGADQPEVSYRRSDTIADLGGGEKIFLESELIATAVGRPRLERASRP